MQHENWCNISQGTHPCDCGADVQEKLSDLIILSRNKDEKIKAQQQEIEKLSTENKTKDRLFLKQLVEVARKYGWDGDYCEVMSFVQSVHEQLGVTPPTDEELEPYPDEDEPKEKNE